jgi:uncharacterized iron-regulated membrane protein
MIGLGDLFLGVPPTTQLSVALCGETDADSHRSRSAVVSGLAFHLPRNYSLPSLSADTVGRQPAWGARSRTCAPPTPKTSCVSLPSQARGALMAYTYPARPQGQVTYHFDREGALLVSTGFDDYGLVAQAIELGVQLHMGNYFGRLNQLVMLAACIGVVVLVVTGTTMWWRRRPTGRIGAPVSSTRIPTRTLLALLLISAVVLPLLAVSLLVVPAFDRWVQPSAALLPWLR